MRGGRDEIGSWCHPPPADRRWVPLLLLASRLSFHPRQWRDWRSSVKSRCEPPNNGAVVEIVAYLKNEMEKGAFSLFHLAEMQYLTRLEFPLREIPPPPTQPGSANPVNDKQELPLSDISVRATPTTTLMSRARKSGDTTPLGTADLEIGQKVIFRGGATVALSSFPLFPLFASLSFQSFPSFFGSGSVVKRRLLSSRSMTCVRFKNGGGGGGRRRRRPKGVNSSSFLCQIMQHHHASLDLNGTPSGGYPAHNHGDQEENSGLPRVWG